MMYRQGDVFIKKVTKLPSGLIPKKDNVVLEGEATGHMHKLVSDAVCVLEGDGEMYLNLEKPTDLIHPEHNTITVDKGVWKVVRQREYSPKENRRVLD